jgi:hypothetical protein
MNTVLAVSFFAVTSAQEELERQIYRVLRAAFGASAKKRAPILPSLTSRTVSPQSRKVLCGNNLRQQIQRAPAAVKLRGGARMLAAGPQNAKFLWASYADSMSFYALSMPFLSCSMSFLYSFYVASMHGSSATEHVHISYCRFFGHGNNSDIERPKLDGAPLALRDRRKHWVQSPQVTSLQQFIASRSPQSTTHRHQNCPLLLAYLKEK